MRAAARAIAARALAAGAAKAQAAREAGVDRATITRWLQQPEFQDLIVTAREDTPEDAPDVKAVKGLQDLVPLAIQTLEDAMAGANITKEAIAAAQTVLRLARQLPGDEDAGPSTLTALIAELDERNQAAG